MTTGKKEKYENSKWILRHLFCCCSNLSNNDNFLKASPENEYGFKRPGLKTGVNNDIFWSEIGSEFGKPGGTPLPRIPRSTSTGTWGSFSKVTIINWPGKLLLFSQDRGFNNFAEKMIS